MGCTALIVGLSVTLTCTEPRPVAPAEAAAIVARLPDRVSKGAPVEPLWFGGYSAPAGRSSADQTDERYRPTGKPIQMPNDAAQVTYYPQWTLPANAPIVGAILLNQK